MTAHQYALHLGRCDTGCVICVGGLALCNVCGGAEGSLPTECPGVPMTVEQNDDVMEARLDFLGGEWVTKKPPVRAGAVYVELVDERGEMVENCSAQVPNVDQAAAQILRDLGQADEAAERERLEVAFVDLMQTVRAAGLRATDDNGSPATREALCWCQPDGRYGVHVLEAAWWGWRAAMGMPVVLVQQTKAGQ